MSEKAEFVAAITEMLGRKAPEPEPGPTRPIGDYSDDELDDQAQAIEAEKQRRREDAEAEAFGQALVGGLTKRRHRTLIDELHP